MAYHWITVCLVLVVHLWIGRFFIAAEDASIASPAATNQTLPVSVISIPSGELQPNKEGIKVTSLKTVRTVATPAQQLASKPQNETANITNQALVHGTDSSELLTSVISDKINMTSSSVAGVAVTQPSSVVLPVQVAVSNASSSNSGSEASASSNSTGGVTNQSASQTSNQQTTLTNNKNVSQPDSLATVLSDNQALNKTDKQISSIPKGTEPQQASTKPHQSEKTKTFRFICDNCTCPAELLQNPYIIDCTGALPGHYIPPWNTFLATETDFDVDNVHLIFEHNSFQEVSEIHHCTVIDSISFSFNEIKSIKPRAFANLPDLKRLSLSHNQLNGLHPEAFCMKEMEWSPLEVLDLSYNHLHYLHNNIFDALHDLAILDLEGNPFNILDSSTVTALNSLHSLQYLNLASTGLDVVPLTLVNPIQHLNRLNLGYNKLTSVPEVVQHGQLLDELVLSGNLMENFHAASFIELKNVKILNISSMPHLKIIYKGAFFPLQSLEVLQCNDNPKLHTVELNIFDEGNTENRKHLEKVEFRNNNLTTLEKEVFGSLDIDVLDVRYNPFKCTCYIAWMQMDARTYVYLNDTRCASPDSVKGVLIKDVDFDSAAVPCPDGYREHASFIDINYIVTESFGFWIFVLLIGLAILVALAMIVIRNKPEWHYKIMRVVSPQRAEYRSDKYSSEDSSKVRYMRQFDDDQGFSEDVITEYSIKDRSEV